MPIKHVVLPALLLAACTAPEPETVDVSQAEVSGVYGSCPRAYPCQPGTPWSVVICDAVCGQDGGYCEPYTWREEEWCVLHPDTINAGLVMCDHWGNPQWQTRCLPYVMP